MAPEATRTEARRGGAPAQERELRAQGRKTMRKLLDAGMTVFERRGYHAARVDDIVKVARTSHGTFYLYFANKADLFRALVTEAAEEMTTHAASLGRVGPDEAGYEELRKWLDRFVDLYRHYGPVVRAWTEADVEDSEFGRLGAEVLADFAQTLASRIRDAGRSPVHPAIAALAMVAMIERLNYYVLSRSIDIDRDEMIDTLATIVHVGVFRGTVRRS